MENADYGLLEKRFGRDRLADRLLKQAGHSARLLHQGEGIFRFERFLPIDSLVAFGLKACGLGGVVRRNFLDVRAVTVRWELPRLPRAFEGFRLLQLTDLHLDLDTALTPRIKEAVWSVPHDAAVVTGDFRNKTYGDYGPCLREVAKLIGSLSPDRWGILGNHDCIEMVPSLEQAGLPMLLNECGVLERSGERLWVAGVDDPHFYRTHDLGRVRACVPAGDCVILLAHSPEAALEAEPMGFDLQLSGHTHGGQLCLPGGFPPVVPCRLRGPFVKGRWMQGSLQGYTSPGTGSCAIPARLNCPPEITLHILHRSLAG